MLNGVKLVIFQMMEILATHIVMKKRNLKTYYVNLPMIGTINDKIITVGVYEPINYTIRVGYVRINRMRNR